MHIFCYPTVDHIWIIYISVTWGSPYCHNIIKYLQTQPELGCWFQEPFRHLHILFFEIGISTAHWAKIRGQRVINSKIEKCKILYLLVGFSPLFWIKTISKIFVTDFNDFLMKFWEISKKCSNFVNFWARKMFFFLKQVRISPEKDWCSHQYPYGGILPQVAAVFVNFYVSTDMIAWWVSVQCAVNKDSFGP